MQVDATNVYFLSTVKSVAALRIANGATTTLMPGSPELYSYRLAADATNLFAWGAGGEILRIPKTLQSGPSVVATLANFNTGQATIAVDSSFVYVAQPDGVYLSGGAVYWIDPGSAFEQGAIYKLAVFSN
jgi:hypothetical protein